MKKIAFFVFALLLVQVVNAQKFVVPEIPGDIDKSEYAQYTQDAMNCIDWLKNHTPSDKQRKDVAAFALWWLTGTPDVHMVLTSDMLKFEDGNLLLLLLGGWAEYAIQNQDEDQLEGCFAGMNAALDYYVKYNKMIPKDKGAEKFLKMRDKGKLKSYLAKSMPE
ncbi:MAG: hypothetical protein J6T59_06010 [Bacteroidales bacterium]|jgi:hypothetical protein|nr:hypothetical protein [Bacteroidales bacterium]